MSWSLPLWSISLKLLIGTCSRLRYTVLRALACCGPLCLVKQYSCSSLLHPKLWVWDLIWCQGTAEKAMAPHSSTLAWKIPWTEQPGRLQSMGSRRVSHDWATSLSLFTFMHWRRKCNPFQFSCLENPRDRGASWAAVSGVAQSRTRLKRLCSSSNRVQSQIWLQRHHVHQSASVMR